MTRHFPNPTTRTFGRAAVLAVLTASSPLASARAQEPRVAWGVIALVDATGRRYTPYSELSPLIIKGMPASLTVCLRSRSGAARRAFSLAGWAGVTAGLGDTPGQFFYRYQINLRHAPGLAVRKDYVNPIYTITYDTTRWSFARVTMGDWTARPDFPRTSPEDLTIPIGPRPAPWADISASSVYPPFPEPRARTDFSNEHPVPMDPCVRDYYGAERPEEPNYVYGYVHFEGVWWDRTGAPPENFPPDQLVRFRSTRGDTTTVRVRGGTVGYFVSSAPTSFGDFEYGFRFENAPMRPTLTSPGVIGLDRSTWHFEDVALDDVVRHEAASAGHGSPELLRIPLAPLPLPLRAWTDKPFFPGMWGGDGSIAATAPALRIDFGGTAGRPTARSPIAPIAPRPVLAQTPVMAVAPTSIFEYTAVLNAAARRQGEVTASGIIWACKGSLCTTQGPWPAPGVAACTALARAVGSVRSYGHPKRELDGGQIADCNRSAVAP